MKHKKLDSLGQEIFDLKYAHPNESGFVDRCKSMAKHMASVEKDDEQAKWYDKFYDSLVTGDLIPGGRIIFGSGRNKQNLLNCYVIIPQDNVESIGKLLQDVYRVSCGGGGIGFNFSKIRPKGDDIGNIKNSAPGSVSVMKLVNAIGDHVKAGKSRRCLAKGTRVLTEYGSFKSIEDVTTNDRVMTLKGWKKVVESVKQGKQKIVRVWHQDGYLDCTENHRIAVLKDVSGNYDWVEAKNLKEGDRLIYVRDSSKSINSSLPSWSYEKPKHSTTCQDITIPELDEGIAWLLGTVAGDGCVVPGSRVSVACHSDDVEQIEQVKTQLARFGANVAVYKKEGENCVNVTVASKQLADYFFKNFKQAHTPIRVPQCIKDSTEKIKLAYVAGVLDTDGCTSNRPISIMASVYIDFVKDIQSLLYSCGIESRLRYGVNYESRLGWQLLHHLNLITLNSKNKFKLMTEDIRIKEIREYQRPQSSNGFPKEFLKDHKIVTGTWSRQNSQMAIDTYERLFGNMVTPIVPIEFLRIEDLGIEEETFDLSVEDEHCFIAEGVLVHNTALMAELNVDHPDLLEFLHVKLDRKELTNFNISVAITDDFIKACEQDNEWHFSFGNREYFVYKVDKTDKNGQVETLNVVALNEEDAMGRLKQQFYFLPTDTFSSPERVKVRAKDLWYRIWDNAVESGEPGIFNLSLTNKYTTVSYFLTMDATNPCVTEDTWVMTPSGPKKVKDLKTEYPMGLGTKVNYLVNGKEAIGTKFFRTGTKPVFRLNTKEGFTVDLTSNHKVLTPAGWVEAGDLTPGSKVLINDHTSFDRAWGNIGNKEIHAGYLMGHLIGDGTFGENRALLCSWGNPGDETSENFIESALTQSFGWEKTSNEETEYRRSISCKKFTNLCLDYDVYRGNKKITDKIEEASSDFYRGFLGGLIDTDGSVQGTQEKGVSVRISQVDKDLLQRAQRMFLRLGIKSVIYKRKDSCNKLMPDGNGGQKEYPCQDLYELIISNDNISKVRDLIIIRNSEKLARLDMAISNYKRTPNSTKFEATFESLEPIGVKEVFDVTVDDIHMFDGNGLILHNCGEIPLESYANCCLGHVNLANMLNENNSDVDWKRLAKTIRAGIRFLDNVLSANHYPIPETKIAGERSRRIGLGTLGLHHMLIKLGIKYGSEKCLEFLDRLYGTIKEEAYLASMYIAREKGSFPEFDADKYLSEEFTKTLTARTRMLIRQNGIRNAVMLTAAPTGTVSMVYGTSTGIEPIFAPMYKRRWKEGNSFKEAVVLDPMFKEALESGNDASHIVGAYDVSPEEHLAIQACVQRHIDNSISKTINLPKDANKNSASIAEMALKYAPYLKGTTVYRAGSRGEEPLQAIPLTPENIQMAKDLISQEKASISVEGEACRIGGECGA